MNRGDKEIRFIKTPLFIRISRSKAGRFWCKNQNFPLFTFFEL